MEKDKPSADSVERELVLFKATEVAESQRSLISTYLTWYAFYWTLNCGSIAWFVTTKANSTGWQHAIAVLGFTGVTAMAMRAPVRVRRSLDEMQECLNGLMDEAGRATDRGTIKELLRRGAWPTELLHWTMRVQKWALVILLGIWLAMFAWCLCNMASTVVAPDEGARPH